MLPCEKMVIAIFVSIYDIGVRDLFSSKSRVTHDLIVLCQQAERARTLYYCFVCKNVTVVPQFVFVNTAV